jgi:hypothetical protein
MMCGEKCAVSVVVNKVSAGYRLFGRVNMRPLVLLLCLAATPAFGDQLHFTTASSSRDFTFDEHGATMVAFLRLDGYNNSPDFNNELLVTYRSGSLESKTLGYLDGVHNSTTYEYGSGWLTFEIEYQLPGQLPDVGGFAGRTRPVTFTVEHEDEDEGFTCDWCPDAYIDIALGRGRFAPGLAAVLGVSRTTNGGWISLYREDIETDEDGRRAGFDNGTSVEILPEPVPEPSLLALSLLGALFFVRHRRFTPLRSLGR